MHNGKAAYRAGTENQQRNAGDQCRDVRVENRVEGAFVAGMDGVLRGRAIAQFFANALVDQYVGVDGHAQSQSDGGNARQGQRGL